METQTKETVTEKWHRYTMKTDIYDLFDLLVSDEIFQDAHDLYQHLDYSGGLHEIIDSNIDINNHSLVEWVADNGNHIYVEDYVAELMPPPSTTFYQLIQGGQFLWLSEIARELVETLFSEKYETSEVS